MLLISQNGEIIVHFDQVALVIEEDGAVYQIIASPYVDIGDNGYIMAEYYSKEDAIHQLDLVIDASQFARRFQFADA